VVEDLARQRAKELFGAERANVQPHSGTQANIAALMALAEPRDKVLAMSLDHGGHLSHGHPKNFSGVFYEFHHYGVEQGTERIDMNRVREQALARSARSLMLAGASAYSRTLDFPAFARDRRRGRREAAGRPGAHRRPRRGRRAPEPRAARRRGDDDDAQDAARPARRR
jgi:glycine/serine hydroxymethyltransferase